MTEHDQGTGIARTALLAGAVAVVGSNSLLLSPILGDVGAGLGASPVEVARAIPAYGGAVAVSALLLGPRIDRLGGRRALRLGLAAVAAATLASALAPGWPALAAAQAVAGAGAGVALPAVYALATALAAPGAAARLLGRVLAGWSAALVGGVPAAAFLTELAGWRSPFLALAALAALAAAAAGALLPADRDPAPAGAPADGPLAPLRYSTVAPLLLICLAFMAAFYGVHAFAGLHLRAALGLGAGEAGLVVLAYGLGFGAAGLGDRALDRIGPRRALPLALAAAAAAAIYAALAVGPPGFAAALALAAAWGCANHGGLNALILLLAAARPERRGAVLGLNSAVTYLGATLGTAAAGPLYAAAGFAWLAGAAALLAAGAAALAATALPPAALSRRSSGRGSFPARGC